ncbi:MAG TPA: RNA pseudouridine synthase [Bacteroidales bacterium]|nr:MAG: RNA pseudouridine synthase [Bacteroidetes bacterium GWF2_33_38]OFY76557.1 MAG: RNA pseudouridine synthase [Bacteroidetes bacterium RIFOXYA12_FULL_33_9]OFY89663.1 MAG: RNA pseudouridine synthase [Bacteroidetes bacterium RIFOXYA2_FULL_33_7]HBF87263.1 RNA pseudouridine synthase [Bacteroidales bacterium]
MDVLYEDNHIIVINKKNSDIVQGDKTGDESLLNKVKAYIKINYNKPGDVFLGLAHRLDRPVSGVVVFARTSKALSRLNEIFKNREVEKIYWAIVKNRPPKEEDKIEHHLVRNEQKNKSVAFDGPKANSKNAILSYKLLGATKVYNLLEITLETGRHHQIRVQLAKIGCPIKGDLKYGFDRSNSDGGISLHARKISFIHPVKKEKIEIVAPPPEDNLWKEFLKIAE